MQNRGLLLDRDGVINVDHGYVGHTDKFQFRDGLFPFLRRAQDAGYRLAIVTNQSGIARGYFTVDDFNNLTAWMFKGLSAEGISIERVFVCFEHIDGKIPEYTRDSFWRKPNPGMVLEAVQKLRLDPARSALLGDKLTDMETAQRGGIKKCLWLSNKSEDRMEGVTTVGDFAEAAKALQL